LNAPRLSDSRRAAKGKRPEPHKDPVIDRLISMIVALTGEVAALRQRLDSVERVAERNGAFSQEEVEGFRPAPDEAARQEELRRTILENVFYLVTKEARDIEEGATSAAYQAVVRDIAADR